jgi:hypothetical protein
MTSARERGRVLQSPCVSRFDPGRSLGHFAFELVIFATALKVISRFSV